MGRWGTASTKRLRERHIVARNKKQAKAYDTTPEKIGKDNNLYPGWLEKFWQLYEGDLIRVVADLEDNKLQPGDEGYLLLHASALKPRKVSFLDDLNDYQAANGLQAFTTTDLPIERVKTVLRTLPYAETWRWRVLMPPQGERFIINDRGMCEFSDIDPRTGQKWPGSGVFFPLGPTIGVLGFRYEPTLHRSAYVFRPLDFSDRLTLNHGYTALLNLSLWEDAERFVVAHPSDRALIENIDNGAQIRLDPSGPYRFRRFGFLGD